MTHSLKVKQLLSNRSHWPSRYQERRIRELAVVRDIAPGIPTTRGERLEAVTRLLDRITRVEAEMLLRQLRECASAVTWNERSPRFKREHALFAAHLSGDWLVPEAAKRATLPPSAADPTEDEKAWGLELLATRRKDKISKAELAAWSASRQVREDADFGTLLVGEWS